MAGRMVREPEQKKPYAVARVQVDETSINTYKEAALNLPTSPEGRIAVRLHRVQFETDSPDEIDGLTTAVTVILSTKSYTAMQRITAPGVIAKAFWRLHSDDTAAGEGTFSEINGDQLPGTWDFGEQGLLITDRELRFGIQGTLNTAIKSGFCTVYYTLEQMEPDEFFAALSVLNDE